MLKVRDQLQRKNLSKLIFNKKKQNRNIPQEVVASYMMFVFFVLWPLFGAYG